MKLGVHYFCGLGVKENKSTAVRVWKDAAHAGDLDAMCALATCYQKGEGGHTGSGSGVSDLG